MNKTLKIPATLHRSGKMEEVEDGTMRLSISSDEPYERYDWMNDERYYEVLDHSEGGPDLSRLKNGAPLLYNHDRNLLLGTLSEPDCDGKRCYVKAKLSEAEDVKSYRTKIKEGILKDTSIGYSISNEGKKVGERDGIPIYKFKFSIHEASLVTIPADTTVGVGRQRSAADGEEMQEICISNEKVIANELQQRNNAPMPEANTPAETAKPAIEVSAVRNEAVTNERKRVADITELQKHFRENGLAGRKIDTSETAAIFIADGKSVREFQDFVVRGNFPEIKPVAQMDSPTIGMKQRDIERYSIIRAINGVIASVQGKKFDGLEREMSDETALKHNRPVDGLGFYIPEDFMRHPGTMPMSDRQRTLFATGSFTAAGALVPVGAQGQSLIELYRNKMHVVAMGAQVLSGLQGTLAIPRQTGGATAAWLAEDATITGSNQAVGQLTLTPHRLAASTAYSTQLLAQSSPDIENFVRNDLMTVLAVEKDRAALLGTGSAGEPLGIYNTPNIATTVDITATASITYAEAVQFETNVAAGNADIGSLGYITSVFIRGTARVTPKFSNTAPRHIDLIPYRLILQSVWKW